MPHRHEAWWHQAQRDYRAAQHSFDAGSHEWCAYQARQKVSDYTEYARRLGALLVVLFGSVARGEFKAESDADILVLVEHPLPWRQVYQRTHGIVQPIMKTVMEYVAGIRKVSLSLIEIVEEGIPLYDSDKWYRRLVAEVQSAKAKWGLIRTDFGWQWTR